MHFGHAVGISSGLPSCATVCFEKLEVRNEDEPDFGKSVRSDARSAQRGGVLMVGQGTLLLMARGRGPTAMHAPAA